MKHWRLLGKIVIIWHLASGVFIVIHCLFNSGHLIGLLVLFHAIITKSYTIIYFFSASFQERQLSIFSF